MVYVGVIAIILIVGFIILRGVLRAVGESVGAAVELGELIPKKYRKSLIVVLLIVICGFSFYMAFIKITESQNEARTEAMIAEKNSYLKVKEIRYDYKEDAFYVIGWIGGEDASTNVNGNTMYYFYKLKKIIYNGIEYSGDEIMEIKGKIDDIDDIDEMEELLDFIKIGEMYYFDEYSYDSGLIKYRSGELRLNIDKTYNN